MMPTLRPATLTTRLLAMLLAAGVTACGGGGGGGSGNGGGGGGGGGGGFPTAQVLACQDVIQDAGWQLIATEAFFGESCGAPVMRCVLRAELGADPDAEACLDGADDGCRTALDDLENERVEFDDAVASGCGGVSYADLVTGLGLDRLGGSCAAIGQGAGDLASVRVCLRDALSCAGAESLGYETPRAPAVLSERGLDSTTVDCSALVLGPAAGAAAHARSLVVTGEHGTLFDGILDGFPGIVPMDGTADLAGNAVAVALKAGVTEERGIAEFPLGTTIGADVTAADVEEVTLGFNIDDVLSTFGPGTNFDGTAAASIRIFTYVGDGSVDLADFEHGDGTPLAVVSTTAHGTITDQTLTGTGPLFFEVDLTAVVKTLLTGGETHLGVVFATDDDQTGTSLDDLGNGGSGPPGVGGARLPFLTVRLAGGTVCGDGNVEGDEECDQGTSNSDTQPDACRTDCQNPGCGDEVVDTGEGCDDGNLTAGDGCDASCAVEPAPTTCGDGNLDAGEECDDGASNSNETPDACREDCDLPSCGDAVIDTGEQCDPPAEGCTSACRFPVTDPSESFVVCQNALAEAATVAATVTGSPARQCLDAALECALDAGPCGSEVESTCDATGTAAASARASFTADVATACAGRPLGDVVGALGFTDVLAACEARGLGTETINDLAICVLDDAHCTVIRAGALLAPRGSVEAEAQGVVPDALSCLALP